jgi:adenylate cyclase
VAGGTTFSLVDQEVGITIDAPPAASEQAFSSAFLHDLRYRDADDRIEVLSRLPEVIRGATTDQELFVRLVSLLLTGIPHADAAAIVAVDPTNVEPAGIRIRHWDSHDSGAVAFAPSGRLICNAVESGKSVLSLWRGAGRPVTPDFTQRDDQDWAFCTPVLGEACRGWALYVSGRFMPEPGRSPGHRGAEELQDDLKFTELTATTLRSLREVGLLQRTRFTLRQFLSPVVLEALAGQDPETVLAPREAQVCVLFCDLRGFSRRSEREADDLIGLLKRVSGALGVMTHHILEQGGVVGDFHGDAAMGFWGWPLEQPDATELACRAALHIRAQFAAAALHPDHPLTGFRIGIGLASGRAVAGKIGTADQVKVSVFGPVVNLASRLETMTRQLRAPVLIDAATARYVKDRVDRGVARVRRVATVRPYGMDMQVEVSELVPPASSAAAISDQHIRDYESALDALNRGEWEAAFQQLHQVPANDRVKDFLTVFIAQHNRTPPPGWDGVIPLEQK